MKVWRFFIPESGAVAPGTEPGSTVTYAGCLAVMVADDPGIARRNIEAWAATSGADVAWLAIAKVSEIEIAEGKLIAFVMF